jgi:hypothetical protein
MLNLVRTYLLRVLWFFEGFFKSENFLSIIFIWGKLFLSFDKILYRCRSLIASAKKNIDINKVKKKKRLMNKFNFEK